MKKIITLIVNGDKHEIMVSPQDTLLDVIREQLGLTGTKRSCTVGGCGLCTVIMEGKAILGCLTLAVECDGKSVTTIEGIGTSEELHPIQQSFIENGAVQCGFCTPGIVMTTKALLDENPRPGDDDIKEALAGTFCRCTGYIKIMEAVKKVSQP